VSEYVYLWEFQVAAALRHEFESHYGREGTWVQLFRLHPGHIDTTLLQDRANPLRYVTIDRWKSVEAYRAFRARYSEQYDELDKRCQNLTVTETFLGSFNDEPTTESTAFET
jgi:heme-degrading monooxygenase HmoA